MQGREIAMSSKPEAGQLHEITSYTKYYEHDGILRAYANRSLYIAMLLAVMALGSLGFAIYVRIQPPLVIHVDSSGNATVVGGPHKNNSTGLATVLAADSQDGATVDTVAPTELEGRAVARKFLERYLQYTPDSVARNLAESLNLMTANLREYTMNRLRDDNTIGKIKDGHIISDFRIRSLRKVPNTAWSFIVFGVKEVHHLKNGTEVTDRMVGQYNVRLVEQQRSETNPSGLLVAEYSEQQMTGDRENSLLQESELEKEKEKR
jgi:type IV secretory pathway TrbF-like protein